MYSELQLLSYPLLDHYIEYIKIQLFQALLLT